MGGLRHENRLIKGQKTSSDLKKNFARSRMIYLQRVRNMNKFIEVRSKKDSIDVEVVEETPLEVVETCEVRETQVVIEKTC